MQGKAWLEKAKRFYVREGVSRQVKAWLGNSKQGVSRQDKARNESQGKARQGKAWLGKAR
jgi:hypothetical protein